MRHHCTTMLLVTTSLAVLFSVPTQAGNLEIRQESYTYKMGLTRDVSTETFVIAAPRISPSDSTPPVTLEPGHPYPLVHFQLGSADLTAGVADAVLETLQRVNLAKSTPLTVTGYTCHRGSDERNQALSTRRAETVAGLLRKNGYTVQAVEGKGTTNPITTDPDKQHQNRRVEIEVVQ